MNIKEMKLFTRKLNEMKDFYGDVLNLTIIKENQQAFTVRIGSTNLSFHKGDFESAPVYHVAINIPENKLVEAKEWISSKVNLNREEEDDEVYFEDWNAHAIYFEDPAGNILEFIARHNLNNRNEQPFSSLDLLNISEVGVVADEVIPLARILNEKGIPNFRPDGEGFTPVGDEHGLLIMVKTGRRWFFSNRFATFYPFEVLIEGIGWLKFTSRNHVVSGVNES
ncbi:ring-cleaving dioxygenase [Bacillus spongiae]|uniref:Ring-cleaving dioxygenase n=1 Tax=Bacillus spongiae TaxID=2683610 RepID=A0ABU8HBC0_9BACI